MKRNRSCRYAAGLALAIGFAVGQFAAGQTTDRVRTRGGSEVGQVESMTRNEVTISKGSTGSRDIPVGEIRNVIFKSEPNNLTQARVNIANGGYQDALERLSAIDLADISSDYVKQDVQFYEALATAQLAMSGRGEISDAGRKLTSFLRSYPNNYHYYEATEALGDLFVAAKRYANAEKVYKEIAKAPFPDYQARAGILIGRALQAQGKHAEAVRQFDAVTDTSQEEIAKSHRLAATLGKAISLGNTDKLDEGVRLIEDVIRDADPEDHELHALAYNALGRAYQQAGRSKDALLAYLHVDVLYSTVPAAHAEALAQLATLWAAIGQEGRARHARQTLQERYDVNN